LSTGAQTSDKQVQTQFNAIPISQWLKTDPSTNARDAIVRRVPRVVPIRSVSTFSFREARNPQESVRAAPWPSLPTRRDVTQAKADTDQEIQRLRADLSSLQHERNSFNHGAGSFVQPDPNQGVHEHRGVLIMDNTIDSVLRCNQARKAESDKLSQLPTGVRLFKRVVEFPLYRQTLLAQRQNIVALFECQYHARVILNEHESTLADRYRSIMETHGVLGKAMEEYSARTGTSSGDIDEVATTVDDAARLRWTAPDQQMYLSQRERTIHCYYDMNGFVEDPPFKHAEFKGRISWTDEERDIFLEKYGQHPKDFRKIQAALPEKSHKDVIEFYYLKRYELNLKELGAAAKKRGGKKKVISEGVAKRNY
jgi:hypothetical protein